MITDTPNPLEISTDYPLESTRAHPPMLTPSYVFTRKRAPHRPLRVIPHTLTELSGPIYGHDSVQPLDNDLTKQGEGEPIGVAAGNGVKASIPLEARFDKALIARLF